MMTIEEAKLTSNRNYQRIKELIFICYGIGVNVEAPTFFRESLRVINVLLLVSSGIGVYGQYNFIVQNIDNIPLVTESICTVFQTFLSFTKMIYFLFTQRKFAKLLTIARTHELLQSIEIFREDFPTKDKLKQEINNIMDKNWKYARIQLIFFMCCCGSILCNYLIYPIVKNTYNYIQGTPDYEPMLLFPVIYPFWKNKGMTFPYYPMLMLFGITEDYIAAMSSVSFDGIFVVLCMHGVASIQALKTMIQQSTNSTMPKAMRVRYLRYCIRFYQRVFCFLMDVRQIYKHIILSQFLISLFVLGIVLFQASVGVESDVMTLIRMLMYMSAAGFQVFIYCFNGQRLTNAINELPLAMYSCEWYEESKEFKQLLQMVIMRTNREFSLDVSWFFTMSMTTLMALIRTSGSYFLLLRKLSE